MDSTILDLPIFRHVQLSLPLLVYRVCLVLLRLDSGIRRTSVQLLKVVVGLQVPLYRMVWYFMRRVIYSENKVCSAFIIRDTCNFLSPARL